MNDGWPHRDFYGAWRNKKTGGLWYAEEGAFNPANGMVTLVYFDSGPHEDGRTSHAVTMWVNMITFDDLMERA